MQALLNFQWTFVLHHIHPTQRVITHKLSHWNDNCCHERERGARWGWWKSEREFLLLFAVSFWHEQQQPVWVFGQVRAECYRCVIKYLLTYFSIILINDSLNDIMFLLFMEDGKLSLTYHNTIHALYCMLMMRKKKYIYCSEQSLIV